MGILVLGESDLRRLAGPAEALQAVRAGFLALAHRRVALPGVLHLDLPHARGEVHVKGAHILGSPFFSIKEAGGFWGNPERGLPVGSGLVLVFDAQTGLPRAFFFNDTEITEKVLKDPRAAVNAVVTEMYKQFPGAPAAAPATGTGS